MLVHGVDQRPKVILREVAAEQRADIIELEVMPDPVHLLVEVDPQFGIYRLMRQMTKVTSVKGCSSHHLRREFPWLRSRLPTLWTHSCFVATVGGAPLAILKPYIENQKNV